MHHPMVKFLFTILLCLQIGTAFALDAPHLARRLIPRIPQRPPLAMTGSEFVNHVSGMPEKSREQVILSQLLAGNMPNFLKNLEPVHLTHELEDDRTLRATIFVTPDYLAIGSARDFVRIPMNLYTATTVAAQFGFILPTRKMVDAVYEQSSCRFQPEPMRPGPRMRTTAYYLAHNQKIREQRLSLKYPLGKLFSGHKKDIVITNRLNTSREGLAIYGWHRQNGIPIQPLSTVHGARYADYSHGVRLVSEAVLIDGTPRNIYSVLQDPLLAPILCFEGPIQNLRSMMGIGTTDNQTTSVLSQFNSN